MAETNSSGKSRSKSRAKKKSSTAKRSEKDKKRNRGAAGTTRDSDVDEPQLPEVLARGFVMEAPFGGTLRHEPAPAPAVEIQKMDEARPLRWPIQASVNRAEPPDVFYRDRAISVDGEIVVILRRDAGFPSGPLPADPGRFRPSIYHQYGVCHILSPTAALRCARGGGYF